MSPFAETIIDHLNIGVSDAARSCAFYEKALAPLGLRLLDSIPPEGAEPGGEQSKLKGAMFGFGRQYKPLFWILGNARVGTGTHFGFIAQTRQQVDDFYAAALAAGGTDNGAPGIQRYHDTLLRCLCARPRWHQHRGRLSRPRLTTKAQGHTAPAPFS